MKTCPGFWECLRLLMVKAISLILLVRRKKKIMMILIYLIAISIRRWWIILLMKYKLWMMKTNCSMTTNRLVPIKYSLINWILIFFISWIIWSCKLKRLISRLMIRTHKRSFSSSSIELVNQKSLKDKLYMWSKVSLGNLSKWRNGNKRSKSR